MPKVPEITANKANLQKVSDCIAQGGVLIHATETCYGITCNALNQAAVRKAFTIKNRPAAQQVSILVRSIADAKKLIEWNEIIDSLTTHYWPGPLTIIGTSITNSVYTIPTGPSHTIAVRVSSYALVQQLLELCSCHLITTSANLHGQPEPYSAAEVQAQYANCSAVPDYLVNSGTLPPNPPSTVVDCSTGGKIVVRQGAIEV